MSDEFTRQAYKDAVQAIQGATQEAARFVNVLDSLSFTAEAWNGAVRKIQTGKNAEDTSRFWRNKNRRALHAQKVHARKIAKKGRRK